MLSGGVFNLTKRVLVDSNEKRTEKVFFDVNQLTVPSGYVLAPELIEKLADYELKSLVGVELPNYFASQSQWNRTFFEDWNQVKTISDPEAFVHQWLHYLTVFFKDVGFLNEDYIHIPKKEITESVPENLTKLFVIKSITKEEVEQKIIDIVSSGAALSQETIDSILTIVFKEVSVDLNNLFNVSKNREFSCILANKAGLVPKNPLHFIRQVFYVGTGSALVIKSKKALTQIAGNKEEIVNKLLLRYEQEYGLKGLTEIFFRYKEVFLALKGVGESSKIINKIRKLANKYHSPFNDSNYLNSVVSSIQRGEFDFARFRESLDSVTPFRMVSLLNHFKICQNENKLYKIRNGKVWVEEKYSFFPLKAEADLWKAKDLLTKKITELVSFNLRGKTVYIPENVDYALPTSEKNFVGNIPEGSSFHFTKDENMIIGVHWFDIISPDRDFGRTDLDLSCLDEEEKIGWDAHRKSDNKAIWFSGDMTSAPKPHGASEFFLMETPKKDTRQLFFLNHYTSRLNVNLTPYSYLIGVTDANKVESLNKEMIHLDQSLFQIQDTIYTERFLGILSRSKDGEKVFYVGQGTTGTDITVGVENPKTQILLKAVDLRLTSKETIKDILSNGVDVAFTDSPENADINLDPNVVTIDTFLNLLKRR